MPLHTSLRTRRTTAHCVGHLRRPRARATANSKLGRLAARGGHTLMTPHSWAHLHFFQCGGRRSEARGTRSLTAALPHWVCSCAPGSVIQRARSPSITAAWCTGGVAPRATRTRGSHNRADRPSQRVSVCNMSRRPLVRPPAPAASLHQALGVVDLTLIGVGALKPWLSPALCFCFCFCLCLCPCPSSLHGLLRGLCVGCYLSLGASIGAGIFVLTGLTARKASL